MIPANVSTFF